jgi:iron complex outermembrane recepter protein
MEKQKMRFIYEGILASLLAVFLIAPVVFAQETKSDEFTLEEITVTAQKREMNVQKTPIAIQTVSGDQLTEEAKTRLDEIMQGVVGVSSQGSQVGTDFYMRGIGTGDFGPPVGGLNQSAVAVMIDGVYQNRGEVVRGGTLDMARVEIMRGTQSTTLGGSSLAGAVSLVSNNPVFKYEGDGSLELGNYHLVDIQGVVNVPLADNQALRVAYSTDKRDGYISNNAGNSDLTNARIKYRLQATDAVNITATFNHQDIGGNGVDTGVLTYYGYWEGYNAAKDPNPADPAAPKCTGPACYDTTMKYPALFGHLNGVKYDKRDNPWDDGYPANKWPNEPFRDTKIDQYSINIDWDLGIGTLTAVPSYQNAHFQSNESPRGASFRSEDRLQKTTQLDMQLTSPNDSTIKWLGGVYYYKTRWSGTILNTSIAPPSGGGPPPQGDCANPSTPGEYTWCWSNTDPNIQTTYAAYGNMTYPVMDNLRIDAGLRYTKDKKSTHESDGISGTDAAPKAAYVYPARNTREGTWNDVTYRVGAEYDVTEQAMLYGLYATGYQPGTWGGNGSITEKQTLEQWTAGVKSRWFNKKLQVNLEGFQSTYHNRPLQGGLSFFTDNYFARTGQNSCGTPGGPPGPQSNFGSDYACYDFGQGVTVPDMKSQGADLTINWVITDADKLDASAEYLKSVQATPAVTITESQLAALPGATAALATTVYNGLLGVASQYDGLVMQNSPKWSANFSYSHIFNLPGGSMLTPKINMEYRGAYWSQGGGPGANIINPGDSNQAAYTLFNAYLNWASSDGKFNVNAYIKNIQNKAILSNYGAGEGGGGASYVTLLPPRTFGVVLDVRL